MPEGPEIRRARDTLATAIEGRRATQVIFHLPALSSWNGSFDGRLVTAVECRGKAMLTHFDHGYSIYSHNQLYGRWVVTRSGTLPDTRRQLRLAIHCDEHQALLYSASDIEVWPTGELSQHPFLSRLGPDVLDQGTTMEILLERLTDPEFRGRSLGALLTDQRFLSGVGNYLRCEILHCSGLHPARRPRELDDDRLRGLAKQILLLPRRSYETGGITNAPQRAHHIMESGASFEEARFHVFRRAGLPCYHCNTPVERISQGGQACYLCPGCQPQY